MSDALIAFLFGLGFGAWIYSKVYRSTGGNSKNAVVVGAGTGLVAGILIFVILGFIFHS